MLEYAKLFLYLVADGYESISWKLLNAADAEKWSNILVLIELLSFAYLLQMDVEHVFFTLTVIKTGRRNRLSENSYDDLVRIAVDGRPLAQWNEKPAVDLWWKGKSRRSVQDTRAPTPSTSEYISILHFT